MAKFGIRPSVRSLIGHQFRIVDPRFRTDPALTPHMLRAFAVRERSNTYVAQASFMLAAGVGHVTGDRYSMVVGTLGIAVYVVATFLLSHLEKVVGDENQQAALMPYLGHTYFVVGLLWGAVSLPAFASATSSPETILLLVTSPVALVIMATTACFVPSVMRAVLAGYLLGVSGNLLNLPPGTLVQFVVAVAILMVTATQLATATHNQLASHYKTQQGYAQSIVQLEMAHNTARQLAETDPLTGLPNRASFTDHVDSLVERQEPFWVALVDLDLFKNINDTMGHHVGDAALVAVAQALRAVTATGTMAARLGGDEFAIAISGEHDIGHFRAMFGRLNEMLRHLRVNDALTVTSGATGGAARFPRDGGDRMTLMSAADLALRDGKKRRRGALILFHESLARRLQRESEIAAGIRATLASGTLAIHYQPQVDIASGRVVGGEALSRFTGDLLKDADIEDVFEIAETHGLGEPLAGLIFASIGRDLRQIRATSMTSPIPISINRCFVQSLLTSGLDRAIVMSSLTLSEALGYSCIAEGIETLAQAREFQALGVRTGQGYLWAAPMPLEQFLAFVRRANAPGIAA